MEDLPAVSIIILNYNGIQYMEGCMRSVLNTDYSEFEVILVDNGSTDGGLELIEHKFGQDPRLKIIRNERNLGFAEGNNVGIKRAMGKYVVFLNNDTEVDPLWLKELVYVMNSDSTIGVAQSKLLLLSNRKKFETAGHYLTPYGYPLETGGLDKGQYDYIREIFGARGASLIIRKEVLDKIGPFDPKFFILFEETDLCWRTWLKGYRIVFAPKSIVFHEGGATLRKSPEHKVLSKYYFLRNEISSMIKNYETKNLVKYLSGRFIIEFRNLGTVLIRRDIRHTIMMIKAFLWILTNLKYVWGERLRVQYSVRTVYDDYIMGRVFRNAYPHFTIYLLPHRFAKKYRGAYLWK